MNLMDQIFIQQASPDQAERLTSIAFAAKAYWGYPQRWMEGLASPDRIEEMFGWYTRYMGRFLHKFDAFVTNGPAIAKRERRRGLTVHASAPLGIEKGFFSPDLRDEKLRALFPWRRKDA